MQEASHYELEALRGELSSTVRKATVAVEAREAAEERARMAESARMEAEAARNDADRLRREAQVGTVLVLLSPLPPPSGHRVGVALPPPPLLLSCSHWIRPMLRLMTWAGGGLRHIWAARTGTGTHITPLAQVPTWRLRHRYPQ